MVAYSFKPRFAPKIAAGDKTQTIRAPRSGRGRHARPGEALQLYTGMRTKACAKIGDSTCARVEPALIMPRKGVALDAGKLRARELDEFARADGFEDFEDMSAFWETQHPEAAVFLGVLICWIDFVGAA